MKNYKKGDAVQITNSEGEKSVQAITKVTKNTITTEDGSVFDRKTGKPVDNTKYIYLIIIEDMGAFVLPFSSRSKAIAHFIKTLSSELKELKENIEENDYDWELHERIMVTSLPLEAEDLVTQVESLEQHRRALRKAESYTVSIDYLGKDSTSVTFRKQAIL